MKLTANGQAKRPGADPEANSRFWTTLFPVALPSPGIQLSADLQASEAHGVDSHKMLL